MIEDSRHANKNKTWFVESLGRIVVQISAHADKADEPDADKADDNMDAQGFLNIFTNVKNMNNSDDDLGGGSDQKSNNDSAAAKRPYPDLIKNLGHWSSSTWLTYIHGQISSLTADLSERMVIHHVFYNVGS
jgi:hypothetical protein